HGLEGGDRAGLEVAALAPDSRLTDVAGDEVHPLDLRDGNTERIRDRGLDEALAEPDPHLARNDLDEEARTLRVHAPEQGFERLGLGVAARGANRLQRRLDVGERDGFRSGASVERLPRPVSEVRMLAEDRAELIFSPLGQRRNDLADGRPAEAESASLGRRKGAAAHVDGGAPEVIVVQRAEVGAEDTRLLKRRRGGADRSARPGEST